MNLLRLGFYHFQPHDRGYWIQLLCENLFLYTVISPCFESDLRLIPKIRCDVGAMCVYRPSLLLRSFNISHGT